MYDMIIVGCGPSSYAFLKGLEQNESYYNKKIALICPSNYKDDTLSINVEDISPKFLQRENLLSLSYYKDSLKNIFVNNFENIGVHGIGGMARIWGASIATFDRYALERNNLDYNKFIKYYDEMKEFLPYSGNKDDILKSYYNMPTCESVSISSKIKNIFGTYLNKSFMIGYPRLLVKTSCDNCNQCLIGCHNDSIWYPMIEDFKNIKNLDINFISDYLVTEISKRSVTLDGNNNIKVLKANKIILGAGVIQNYKLLAQLEKKNENKAKLYTTPAIAFAFLTPKKNNHKNFFGMGNASFILNKDEKVKFYGNLYDGYSLSLSNGLVFSKSFILDKCYKFISRYMIAGAGFMSSDNVTVDMNYKEGNIYINGKYSENYYNNSSCIIKKLKLFTKQINSVMLHIKKTKIGADIHYAGGIPEEMYDNNLIIDGKLKKYDSIVLIGGSTFSYLSPESPTLSFMANSYRIGKLL